MKFPVFVRRISRLFIACCIFVSITAHAQNPKPIRLRNPVSAPNSKTVATQGRSFVAAPASVSGLYIVQFREPLRPHWRAQLARLGVTLTRHVPEDAYVARMKDVNLTELRALNFIEFVGEYGASQKIHSRLAQLRSVTADDMEIAVLLSAEASDAEVWSARDRFARVTQESKTGAGRVLRGVIDQARFDALAASDAVLWMESAPKMKLNDEVSAKIVAGDGGPNLSAMQSLGYDGSGVKVAVADSGLDNGEEFSMHPDLLGRTPAFFHYGLPGQLDDAADEHSHGTHCAGIIAGNGAIGEVDENGNLYGLGVAPGASIIAQRIFDGVGNYAPPPSFERMTRDAKRAGADIGSNSWGDDTQGRYDISAMEFDALVRDADALALGDQQYILEFSAGNAGSGQQTIGSPAVAKNVIATGASQNDRVDFVIYGEGTEAMADFSSRGPCEDGRIKPDVCAPGTWIASLQSQSATDQYAWAGISSNYQYQGGTSQSGPHVSGAAAVFVQFYRATHTNATPSPALVKAALIHSAVDLDDASGTTPTPNNDEGWGRVDLTQIIGSPRTVDFVDQTALLTNGQVFERSILVAGSDEPLIVTLTYTDVPGFPGAIPALVNDLDLEIVAPDGAIYRGNQFDQGASARNATGRDQINNVEGIRIFEPKAGQYFVRVRARNILEDARTDSPFVDQDFALVTSGNLVPAGSSLVALDRAAYRAPDLMRISVIDADRAGEASLSVLVRSTSETLGENLVLLANGSGSFTGSVATLTGVASSDGNLQIAHADEIEVRYFDASASATRSVLARADFVSPIITGVRSTNEFGLTVISWTTDEPATSTVRYNTNATLNKVATSSALTIEHSIALSGLVAGRTYLFHVASSDEAGNAATNANGGSLFSFVAPTVAKVLLVDDYTDLLFEVPPLTAYTAALAQLGITYEIWDTTANGSPGLTNLQPYRCVIWRLPEFVDTWSLPEQNALRDYVAGGGSLFVASMEVLSRLEEGGFNSAKLALLHASTFIVDNEPGDVPDVIGAVNDPVGAGISVDLDYTAYEDTSGFKELIGIPNDISDSFTVEPNAAPVFYNSYGETIGMKWPRTGVDALGRVVFLSFPLDAVPTDGATNNRAQLLGNVLGFLVPGFDGRSTLALDRSDYTIPDQVVIEVDDADMAGNAAIVVNYSSTTQNAPTALALQETARPGTFRGVLTLVAQTNATLAGSLRVNNGDTIDVSYNDASTATVKRVSAAVDTVVPTITGVSAVADYESFTVTWTTSEPCDSTVQFGKSLFLDRSVFDPLLTTEHEVTINGLDPATTYLYQVVGRDIAGNTVVADNGGILFTNRTLTPETPPWSDNLNGAVTNWSTFDADGSQSSWAHGNPTGNSSVTGAHSPTKCWASCISDLFMDYSETFLVSPAVHLTGGNSAKLTFWHKYDFSDKTGSDVFEAGTLYLITTAGSQAFPLAQYVDANADWEQETIDLSPYAGRVVYLVWAHQLVAFDIGQRSGWLVDDIAVTVTNVTGGVINVTNNIWQANTFLSGASSRNIKGRYGSVTNAPSGDYVLEFADVLFYNTPAAQTNTLAPGGTINFTGNYTFTDANSNSIPDAWEAVQFSAISNQRGMSTDTDADGLSDWGEFVAGTDPNNPPPRFKLTTQTLPGNMLRLAWPSVTNHNYRVHASSNGVSWTPHSAWFNASGTNTLYTFNPITNGAMRFFRVEAAPFASPIAGTFRTTATTLINRQIRLEWPSAPGHGYRVMASANLTAWLPYSDWIRATSYATGFTLPAPTNSAPRFFRVEAQP